jgi:murein L,D-transpeptidase YcbB/YkuD
MTWSWQWKQGYHERKSPADWKPSAPYRKEASGAVHAAAVTRSEAPPTRTTPEEDIEARSEVAPESDPYAPENLPVFLSEELRDAADLEKIARGNESLKQGDRGPGVKALQAALIALGNDVPGGADGIFGKGTAEAVKKVQSDAGLEVTGIADAEALIALDQRLRSKAQA